DRVSAYDHVLPTPIPDKGKILTQLSLWWFGQLADLIPNQLIDAEIPAGFALREYRGAGAVCGVPLPSGLTEGSRLPEPIFTPATKAPRGQHDENIPFSAVAGSVGADVAAELRRITLEVYRRGAELAAGRGIIVADTKIELGFGPGGGLVLADEVLTPDSSRFWPADRWEPGRSQPSLDKQYVRDWLTSPESGWDRGGPEPPPPLPGPVVERTRDVYIRAYESITGRPWR